MAVEDWYREKKETQSSYDYDKISKDVYETRTKFAIGMIYKCGNKKDKEAAERMAKAHGYEIVELIKIVC